MFKLSRRSGTANWQVRKRYPLDVALELRGEFIRTTGTSDRRAAEELLPALAAEYQAMVKAARDRLKGSPPRHLSEPEMQRLAFLFMRETQPAMLAGPVSGNEQRALLERTRTMAASMKAALGRQDYSAVEPIARALIERERLPIPADSPSLPALHRLLTRAWIELYRIAEAHLEGDADYAPEDDTIRALWSGGKDTLAKPGRTVADLIDAYRADKEAGWSTSTVRTYTSVFRLMRDVLGTTREVATIVRDDARSVFETVKVLPRGLGRASALRDLSVPEAVEEGRILKLPTLSAKTINDSYMALLVAVFGWARKEQWITGNPFTGLSVHDAVDAADKRDPFTPEQLKMLFSAAPWNPRDDSPSDRPSRFWVPLIALFSGMRRAEICGLRVADVVEREGELVMLVRPEGRRLKTANARRVMPVHPELKRIGFPAYVAAQREAGAEMLFPDVLTNKHGQVGDDVGDWFGRLLKTNKITGRRLGLHSFRHNFQDRLREAHLHGTAIGAELAGRSKGGDVSNNYGSGFPTKMLTEAVAKIVYPRLDLSHLHISDQA